ncbi:helix-turn-helix transcriptional regulator [Thiobacillus sp.]|jgi:transcriptional regulator with XRE-family HTH domain|uniref:helix-turn-helix transcriptional regulator n=1 Tax=Thiobacillus sp. TaxID=924 RepID=UPI0025E01201|nr:helix-turn-helix transcriptional regulator [Thiobacillus sp.]
MNTTNIEDHPDRVLMTLRQSKLKEWFDGKTIPRKEKGYIGQLLLGKEVFGSHAARRIERDYGMPSGYLDGVEAFDGMTFPARIKALRLRRGLTQEQLAIFVGVSQTAVAAWENGKRVVPRGSHLLRLGEALGFDAKELFGSVQGEQCGSAVEVRLLAAFRALPEGHQRIAIKLIEALAP